jgi:hypothetical protein
MGVAVAYAIAYGLLFVPALAIPFRLIELPLMDLVRTVRGVFAGSLLMAAVTATVRMAMVASQLSQPVVLAISVVTGVVTYLAWLRLTNSHALLEARLAWSRIFGRRGVFTV